MGGPSWCLRQCVPVQRLAGANHGQLLSLILPPVGLSYNDHHLNRYTSHTLPTIFISTCIIKSLLKEGALEESTGALVLCDLGPAVEGALVHDVSALAARLHHEATSDSVEGITDDA